LIIAKFELETKGGIVNPTPARACAQFTECEAFLERQATARATLAQRSASLQDGMNRVERNFDAQPQGKLSATSIETSVSAFSRSAFCGLSPREKGSWVDDCRWHDGCQPITRSVVIKIEDRNENTGFVVVRARRKRAGASKRRQHTPEVRFLTFAVFSFIRVSDARMCEI
jgi:hypothetical protein